MSLPRSRIHGVLPQTLCADCGAAEPDWASLNRGVLICSECCNVHRSLGRHVSQVRSLTKGAWAVGQLALMKTLYDNGANNIWEHQLLVESTPSSSGTASGKRKKPNAKDPVYPTKADFIRAKYEQQRFALRPNRDEGRPLNLGDLNRELWACVRTGHVETTLKLLALGADPNYADPDRGTTPMYVAAKENQLQQVELVAIYGGDPSQSDRAGQTPAEIAKLEGHSELSERLTELEFEITDRLTMYLCGRKPDHRKSPEDHFLVPEMAVAGQRTDVIQAQIGGLARRRLRLLADDAFQRIAQDAYDEVDRRDTDAAYLQAVQINHDRFLVPFLPVNPELSATRNQSRQKLAKLPPRAFAAFLIDVLSEAKRRYLVHIGVTNETSSLMDSSQSLHTVDQSNSLLNGLENSRIEMKEKSKSIESGKSAGDSSGGVETSLRDYDEVPDACDSSPRSPDRRQSASDANAATTTTIIGTEAAPKGVVEDVSLMTLDDYLELREQIANSDHHLHSLTDSNTQIINTLKSLETAVGHLVDENSQLREELKALRTTTTPHHHSISQYAKSPSVPPMSAPGLPPYVYQNGNSQQQKKRGSSGAIIDNNQSNRRLSLERAQEAMLKEARDLSNSTFVSDMQKPTHLPVLSRQVSTPEYEHIAPSDNAVRYSSVVKPGRSPSSPPPTTPSVVGSPATVVPDLLILQTERLTAAIKLLLADAQRNVSNGFPAHAQKISSIADEMISSAGGVLRGSEMDACLLQMRTSCRELDAHCALPPETDGLAYQVCQSAYRVAKGAKLLMVILQQPSV